uniref:Uncharacterized protein n=1 Tax=Urocitellus parryii TaxID=9999 RepID=A0A8D2IAU0_UROPR
ISSFIFLNTCVALQRRWLLTYPAQYCFSVLALNDKPNFLLKHVAGHGSYEVPPTSAFWLWLLGIFNLIYLFPLFKTIFSTLKKKKKAKHFVPF